MAHNHWREKCALCKSVITWCKCAGTTVNDMYMHTKWNLCGKCAVSASMALQRKAFKFDGIRWKLDPNTPLKYKEYFMTIGNVLFYYVDEEEIGQKWTGEFVEAGNWRRFNFIPKNECWVDYRLNQYKVKKAVFHEFVETAVWPEFNDYDKSHSVALKLEDYLWGGAGGIDENINNILNEK